MRKFLIALMMILMLGMARIGNAGEFSLSKAITPTNLEGDMVYSFRYKQLTGAASLKAGSIWDNWATWKAFAIPEFKEYGIGLEINLLEKLAHGKEVGQLLKVLTLSPGVYVASDLSEFPDIKKIQIDTGVLLTIVRIKF